MQVSSVWSTTIEEPASCVAFCPSRPNVLVIGTYLLHKSPPNDERQEQELQNRTGSLEVYVLTGTSLQVLSKSITESAILDIEWSPHHEHPVLAVATSTGTLDIYTLDEANVLHRISSAQIADQSILVLDLVWHPVLINVIGVTLSSGETVLCQRRDDAEHWTTATVSNHEVNVHSLEPWTLAFQPDGSRLYSGGDDMVIQCSDIADLTSPSTIWSDRKVHGAGVTAILPLGDNLIVSGSYDDHIRLINAPSIGRKQVLAELNLGGGVWRLKLIKSSQDGQDEVYVILASCMHAGTRIVKLQHSQSDWSFEVLARFEEHESMNYGSDSQPSSDSKSTTFVSTSFYDRKVCVWQFSV